MTRDIVTRAVEAAGHIDAAARGGAFDRSVQDFMRVLRTVPDESATAWNPTAGEHLQAIADEVVELIERRLNGRRDRPGVQQRLASAIYEIRAAIEEADRWERHYRRRFHSDDQELHGGEI